MKNILLFFYIITFINTNIYSQTVNDTSYTETDITLTTNTGQIFGTLCTPKQFTKIPVALIIAGSGPTDRDGNSIMLKSDAYKLLAHKLCRYNIATVRYDKRGIAKSKDALKSEADIRFEDGVNDAADWVHLLRSDPRFSKVIIIGHSEGSLIGMIAATKNTDEYISIAGAGQSADKIISEQLKSQPEPIRDSAAVIMDSLLKGKILKHVPLNMLMLFRPSVQPYIMSWFKYDPQTEIKKLTIPVLIIQGTDDLQVGIDDAKRLSTANPSAKLVLIKGMNHIFRKVGKDKKANAASYSNPSLPIDAELVTTISSFINAK
jgi:uncharacterized protein